MAGTMHGRINALSQVSPVAGTTNYARAMQEVFVSTWRFLDGLPNCTRIASNSGIAAAGTLNPPSNVRNSAGDVTPGYWDEAKNVNHGAFGVWRFQSATWQWDLFLQLCTYNGAYTIAGQNIVVATGLNPPFDVADIIMQAAWGELGGAPASPWLGGTANQWADQPWAVPNVPGPRWGVPGGTVDVLPRSNNASGNYDTNKNNGTFLFGFSGIYDNDNGIMAFGMNADDDSFQLFFDKGNVNQWTIGGVHQYLPRSGVSIPRPYCMLTRVFVNQKNIPIQGFSGTTPYVFGIPTQNSYFDNEGRDGGILVPSTAINPNPRSAIVARLEGPPSYGAINPSNAGGPVGPGLVGTYDEWSVLVGCLETGNTPSSLYGMLGTLDPAMYREIFNTGSSDAKSDLSRCFLGGTTALASIKASVPWDGVTTPRSYAANPAVSREGVTY